MNMQNTAVYIRTATNGTIRDSEVKHVKHKEATPYSDHALSGSEPEDAPNESAKGSTVVVATGVHVVGREVIGAWVLGLRVVGGCVGAGVV